MSYGIVGAHRVGKSTLCELLSNQTGLGLLHMKVGNVFAELGINPAESMSFSTRLMVQNMILDRSIAFWMLEPTHFFADRTPIDMLAYTMADMDGHICMTKDDIEGFNAYKARCYEATHRFFGALFVIQPGIALVDPGDKPTARIDIGFIEHLNSIMIGLTHAEECKAAVYVMPRDIINLDERAAQVIRSIKHSYGYIDALKKTKAFH